MLSYRTGRPVGFRLPRGPTSLQRIEALLDTILSISQDPAVIAAADQIADICTAHMETIEAPTWTEYDLTPGEAGMFSLLLSKRGQVCSKQALFTVSCARGETMDKSIEVRICYMRKKLPADKFKIETVWGKGYRLLPELGAQSLAA